MSVYAAAFLALDLQIQDRVIRYEGSVSNGLGVPEETVYYVECVDYVQEQIHVMTPFGARRKISFAEVSDIQKAEAPVLARVPEAIWRAHGCDPAFMGKPVRVLAVSIFEGKINGVAIPKWPGTIPNATLSLSMRRGDVELLNGVSEIDLITALPSSGFNPRRYGDPATVRNRGMRVARNHVAKFIGRSLSSTKRIVPPMDPSLRKEWPALKEGRR